MPTFINNFGMSIIDHILCTERCIDRMDGECFVGDTVKSDHMPLLLRTRLRKTIPLPPNTRAFKDYKRTDINLFQANIEQKIAETPIPVPNSIQNINRAVTALEQIIVEASEIATPQTTIRLDYQTLPKLIVEKIKYKRKLYRQYTQTHDPVLKTEWDRLNAQIKLQIKTTEKQNGLKPLWN
ncbi:hypothetical protein JTB14_006000 [Gonioctena quinquepunctata]|nr:hypothetical protein JTB14_006000 [Gonioctena quinquepunctata]